MYDVVIIGSGPAGLSAAVYAKRAGMDVLLLEKEALSGGQIVYTNEVDNYLGFQAIGGYDLAEKFLEHAMALNIPMEEGEVVSVIKDEKKDCFILSLEDGKILTKYVIIATGARHRLLGVTGEKEFTGAGVSYCATCDGAFFAEKTVAVIGGGDVAAEDALYLANICRQVCLIHRRGKLRAAKVLQDAIWKQPNITFYPDSTVKEIQGKDTVESLLLVSDTEQVLKVDGVFIAVGMEPVTDFIKDVVALDDGGYIIAGEDCKTNVSGIYAAGDVRTKPARQIITAVADGALVVHSIRKEHLQSQEEAG